MSSRSAYEGIIAALHEWARGYDPKLRLNAVLAKARAMYGKRLTGQDYAELVNCHSLGELLNTLKTQTNYAQALEAATTDIGVAQIEELLRMHVLRQAETLCRYEISVGENLYRYFIVRNDIKQILSMIRLLIIGKPEKYLLDLPPFFNKHTELDLYELAAARSFKELVGALDGSPYKKIVEPFAADYDKRGMYIIIEARLNKYLRQLLLKIINRGNSEKGRQQIHDIINYMQDMETIVNIYRLIRLADADSDMIKDYIDTEFTNFSSKEIKLLVNAQKARDMFSLISETCYSKDFARVDFSYLEDAVQKLMYRRFSREIRYYTNATAVVFCYIFLAENEVRNIIHIVEGIRYGNPPEKISAMLVGAED